MGANHCSLDSPNTSAFLEGSEIGNVVKELQLIKATGTVNNKVRPPPPHGIYGLKPVDISSIKHSHSFYLMIIPSLIIHSLWYISMLNDTPHAAMIENRKLGYKHKMVHRVPLRNLHPFSREDPLHWHPTLSEMNLNKESKFCQRGLLCLWGTHTVSHCFTNTLTFTLCCSIFEFLPA